jgi:uncharacterized membrane protein YcaP (DUF421 family)
MLPWWELIARAIVVDIFLLVSLRVTGKRQVGQLCRKANHYDAILARSHD